MLKTRFIYLFVIQFYFYNAVLQTIIADITYLHLLQISLKKNLHLYTYSYQYLKYSYIEQLLIHEQIELCFSVIYFCVRRINLNKSFCCYYILGLCFENYVTLSWKLNNQAPTIKIAMKITVIQMRVLTLETKLNAISIQYT